MELILTKAQFCTLVKLAYWGEWVANGHRLRDDCIKEYSEMEQYLWNQVAREKYFTSICRREECYLEEFDKHGLDQLEIKTLKEEK